MKQIRLSQANCHCGNRFSQIVACHIESIPVSISDSGEIMSIGIFQLEPLPEPMDISDDDAARAVYALMCDECGQLSHVKEYAIPKAMQPAPITQEMLDQLAAAQDAIMSDLNKSLGGYTIDVPRD